jgi:hypothetical protein
MIISINGKNINFDTVKYFSRHYNSITLYFIDGNSYIYHFDDSNKAKEVESEIIDRLNHIYKAK